MPVNIKVIRPKDFIKTTVTDLLNFEVSKQTLLDIAAQIEQPGQYEVLLDTREAETVLSVVDIFELGQALADHPFLRRSKIVVLTSMNHIEQARFLEIVTANQGVRVRVFTGFEEAITWLVMQEAS